jgi:hypothetical protein
MTDANQTYSAKSTATRAARKALGANARPGHDFILEDDGSGRWSWSKKPKHTDPGAPPKEKAVQSPGNAAAAPEPAAPTGAPKRKASEKAHASGPRMNAKAQAAADDAAKGILPEPPDFSKPTHRSYRKKLAALVALRDAGDIAGLEAFEVQPVSTSRTALYRFKQNSITALKAQRQEPAL